MDKKQGFIFADRMWASYEARQPRNPNTRHIGGTYGINSTLLECLGKEQYERFCDKFKKMNPGNNDEAYFKKTFAENPVQHESILYDSLIFFYWHGISRIMECLREFI